jgi:alkaline phosphatase D
VNRRQWLQLVLGASAGTMLGSCGDEEAGLFSGFGDAGIEPEPPIASGHGVATFEVGPESAIASFYSPKGETAWVWVEAIGGDGKDAGSVMLDTETRTGVVDLIDLDPDTDYRWRAVFDTARATEWASFRTAPAGGASTFTFLYSADIDPTSDWDSPIFATMAASDAAFWVCLGDWPYADTHEVDVMQERFAWARTFDRGQLLTRAKSCFAIYDDHEVHNDWDGASNPQHVADATRIWDKWFPLWDRRAEKVRYRSWMWGDLAELFLLDTRAYRSPNDAVDDMNKTLLGAEQMQWLEQGLMASDAPFKIILSSVPLDFGVSNDTWEGFTTERARLYSFLAGNSIEGVVVLSGDRHWFAAHQMDNGLREFQVGPLARGLPELPQPAPPQALAREVSYNYGEVAIARGEPPTLTFTCRGPTGEALYTESFNPGDLIATG